MTTSLSSVTSSPNSYATQCSSTNTSRSLHFGNGINETTPVDSVNLPNQATVDPVVNNKPPLLRTLNGVKSAAWKAAWTGLWGLLALKGAVLLCGVGALPPLYFGMKSAGDAVRKFKEGYNA